MTAAERQHLRHQIDQHVRHTIRRAHGLCAGCGTDLDNRSAGCKTCNNRWLRRKWRQDDDYRAKDNRARMTRKFGRNSPSPDDRTITA